MKRAVVIGLNYTGSNAELNGCVQDMVNHIKLLIDLGYRRNEITILTDAPTGPRNNQIDVAYNKIDQHTATILFDSKTPDQFPPIMRPTSSNYIKALTDAILTKDVDGKYITQIAMIYTGHGGGIRDLNNDETDRQDECVYLMDDAGCYDWKGCTDDAISTTIINAYTQNKNRTDRELTIYAIYDSCHSGTIMDLPTQMIIQNNIVKTCSTQKTKYDGLKNLTVFCISGCLDNETSGEGAINGKYSEGFMSHYYHSVIRKRMNDKKYPCDLYQMVNDMAMEVYRISRGTQSMSLSLKINQTITPTGPIGMLQKIQYCLGKNNNRAQDNIFKRIPIN